MSGRGLILLGFSITIAFIAVVICLGAMKICTEEVGHQVTCISNYEAFLKASPNEKGDTLSGIAGSLAFLWIIITVLLQSNELSLQRQELVDTRNTLEKQTGFLASQDNERARLAVDKLIETKLQTLERLKQEPSFESFDVISHSDNTLLRNHVSWISNKSRKSGLTNAELSSSLKTFVETSKSLRTKERYLVPPDLRRWNEIKDVSKEILSLAETASPAMHDRIERIEHIDSLHRDIAEALSPELWEIPDNGTTP